MLLLNASAWIPHAAAVNVLILAGQSNMVGQANVTATLPGADPVDSQIRFYFDVTNTVAGFQDSSGQMFGPLRPWTFNASTSRFGPEMSLGRELATVDGLDLAMIKVAIGGSDIARWLPGAVDYNKLTSAVIDGIGELQTAGESVNVLGLVWLQGESDVISTARADAYAANLANFIGGFRGAMHSALPALGFDQLPTLLVEPADWRNGSSPGSATP
ncbi:MAG TPA: sialate O-acetylesterase, partial [Lacipirellulaceae bacterium]|nr:sialate O-acetylesterase [Lacipirellulaceae bacterium]